MRIRSRFLLRSGLGLTASLTVLAAATIDQIDETPFFMWGSYRQTQSELQSDKSPVRRSVGPLMAGFGRAELTPHLDGLEDEVAGTFPGVALAGFSERKGAAASGVRDPLFVKTVAVEVGGQKVIFTTLDMLIVPPAVVRLLSEQVLPSLGVKREQLYIAATHTHSGPGGWGKGLLGRLVAGSYVPGMERFIASRTADSIRAALTDMRPASLGAGRIEFGDFVKNRLVETGRTNPSLPFLTFHQEGGRSAVITSYAAHPTVLGAENRLISADYPGALTRTLEGRGIDLALFMAGAVGSQAPRYQGERGAAVEAIGSALAERLLPALRSADLHREVDLSTSSVLLTVPDPQMRFADRWRLRPWVARLILPPLEGPMLQAVRIGNSIWLSTPSDYSGELALLLEDRLARHGMISNVTSFNGDYVGYLLPGYYDHYRSYESRDMNFYGPGMGDYVQDILERLADKVRSAPPSAEAVPR